MQKVKVHRYVSGKRPDYAPHSSSEDESEDEEFVVPARLKQEDEEEVDAQVSNPNKMHDNKCKIYCLKPFGR